MNKKGFTLIELMVVVAIIGILASVAVPQFQRFQAKAKQANAKAELSGIYMAEQTFYTEFGQYSDQIAAIGYAPDGFGQAQCPDSTAPAAGVVRYYRTGFAADAGTPPAWPTGVPGGDCEVTFYVATVGANSTSGPTGSVIDNAGNFTASATGQIYGGAADDVWTIDQNKALINLSSGIGQSAR